MQAVETIYLLGYNYSLSFANNSYSQFYIVKVQDMHKRPWLVLFSETYVC